MANKSDIYWNLENELSGEVPEKFCERCIRKNCTNIGMSEEGIQSVLKECKRLKGLDYFIAGVLLKISYIVQEEELDVMSYEEYKESKKAIEALVGDRTISETPGKKEKRRADNNQWIIEQYEKIGMQPPESVVAKKEEDLKEEETSPREVKKIPTTINVPVNNQNIQKPKTSPTMPNEKVTVVKKYNNLPLEEFNTPDARDRLIIRMMMEGKTLNFIFYNGIPLSKIEESEVIPEVKAFVKLLKARINELSDNVRETYGINGTLIRKNDLKRVFDWISGKKVSELEGKKQNLRRILRPNIHVDSIKINLFRDENGDYEICSMIFVIENMKQEHIVKILGYSEKTKEKLSCAVSQVMQSLKQNSRKQIVD